MSPGTGREADSEVAQLSVHPYPNGPGDPACVCSCASNASYARVNVSAGPKVGMLRSVSDWLKSPFSVFTGSPAAAWASPGSAGSDPPISAPDGTSPPVDGASAVVPADGTAPASTYACPADAPSEAVNNAGVAALSYASPPKPAGHAVNDSSTEHAGDVHGPIAPLVSPLNAASATDAHVFTVPAFDEHDAPCPVTLNPPPSTSASNGTLVPALAVEYSQFSDTYNPVPLPASAYLIPSDNNALPELPASTGAVPSTDTSPVTAGPHVAAVDSASEGTVLAHVPPLEGSPITSAEYALNCAVVIASQVDGVATVTVAPSADAACASALLEPPLTLVDKISTVELCARAGAARTTAATDAAATPATTTDAGTSAVPVIVTGASVKDSHPRNPRRDLAMIRPH